MSNLRRLPSVDRLIQAVQPLLREQVAYTLVRGQVRATLADLRSSLRETTDPAADIPTLEQLADQVRTRIEHELRPTLRPVLNASGVIIQTNLGRAPLSTAAMAAMQQIGTGYSNLEYELEQGRRGSRSVHLEAVLCRLTGAEAALAVNNNAAAIYLALIALAAGREVIVSRGQAVEIGGGFRIPDVLRQSGATLVEVGTTNRTYARDYAAAITDQTALLLRVHTSNFRLMGFVNETGLSDLAQVGREHGVPVLDDLGSGTLLDTRPYGLAAEPTVPESIAAGADLVTFSGDKLLGGPQAGLIVGRADLVAVLRRHPLARAMRIDKTTIAGMEATLRSYLRGTALADIPVWRMIATRPEQLHERAQRLQERLHAGGVPARVVACESAVGGGSLPGDTLPSYGVALDFGADGPEQPATRLRLGEPAIVARITDEQLVFDLRSILPDQDDLLATRIIAVLGSH
jgi:L-seryl-tRNA(Ser) seleniumtransferase